MTSQDNEQFPVEITIIAGRIASELYRAGQIARQLSLTAKNSRAMVLRAGRQAAGLQVISDFFAELAARTICLSSDINRTALDISSNSVATWRTQGFIEKLKISEKKMGSESPDWLSRKIRDSQLRLQDGSQKYARMVRTLGNYLEEIGEQLRASTVIAVNFRLEATQTGEFQPMLNHMADDIESLSLKIKEHIDFSQKILRDLKV